MSGDESDGVVFGLPPWNWPALSPNAYIERCPPEDGFPCYGGTGTQWLFHVSEVRDRLIALGLDVPAVEDIADLVDLINDLLRAWQRVGTCVPAFQPESSDPYLTWFTPSEAQVGRNAMRVVRAAIHATLGSFEDLEHVFHLAGTNSGADTADLDSDDLIALGAQLRTQWASFINGSLVGSGGAQTNYYMSNSLVYDRISLSYLQYTGANPAVVVSEDHPRVTKPGDNKPTTLVPTVQVSIPATGAGSAKGGQSFSGYQDIPLPLEVALCVSLITNRLGASYRGRTYLGGLVCALMDGSAPGYFKATTTDQIGAAFGLNWVAGVEANTDYQLCVASERQGTRQLVQGVRIGHVPDSQRRRRRNQPENRALVWGTA